MSGIENKLNTGADISKEALNKNQSILKNQPQKVAEKIDLNSVSKILDKGRQINFNTNFSTELQKIQTRINLYSKEMKSIQESMNTNTGLATGAMDFIMKKVGGESGSENLQKAYKELQNKIQNEIISFENKFIKPYKLANRDSKNNNLVLNSITISSEQNKQNEALLNRGTLLMNKKLELSISKMTENTGKAFTSGENKDQIIKNVTVVKGVSEVIIDNHQQYAEDTLIGVGGLMYKGGKMVELAVEGTVDLVKFIGKYEMSVLGLSDKKYSQDMIKVIVDVCEYCKGHNLPNEAYQIAGKEINRISSLKGTEQTIAISELTGTIIGLLATIYMGNQIGKGVSTLKTAVQETRLATLSASNKLTAIETQIQRLKELQQSIAIKNPKLAQQLTTRIEGLEKSMQNRAINQAKKVTELESKLNKTKTMFTLTALGDTILNGLAETAIGKGLGIALKGLGKVLITTTSTVGDKISALNNLIKEVDKTLPQVKDTVLVQQIKQLKENAQNEINKLSVQTKEVIKGKLGTVMIQGQEFVKFNIKEIADIGHSLKIATKEQLLKIANFLQSLNIGMDPVYAFKLIGVSENCRNPFMKMLSKITGIKFSFNESGVGAKIIESKLKFAIGENVLIMQNGNVIKGAKVIETPDDFVSMTDYVYVKLENGDIRQVHIDNLKNPEAVNHITAETKQIGKQAEPSRSIPHEYPLGQTVLIKRSDGTIVEATVIEHTPDGKVNVKFIGGTKVVSIEHLDSINKKPEISTKPIDSLKAHDSFKAHDSAFYNEIFSENKFNIPPDIRQQLMQSYETHGGVSRDFWDIANYKIPGLGERYRKVLSESLKYVSTIDELKIFISKFPIPAAVFKQNIGDNIENFIFNGNRNIMDMYSTGIPGFSDKVKVVLNNHRTSMVQRINTQDQLVDFFRKFMPNFTKGYSNEEVIKKINAINQEQIIATEKDLPGFENALLRVKNNNIIKKTSENIKINEANSFDELIQIIKSEQKIGNDYSDDLIDLVREYERGEVTLKHITRKHGLRDKVALLKNNLLLKQNIVLKELWPNGLKSITKQGDVGNCYFVAAFNRFKFSSNGAELIQKMITPDSSGGWYVKFEGHNKRIFIEEKDLLQMGDKKMTTQNKGDLIIERAVSKIIHEQRNGLAEETYFIGKQNTLNFEGGFHTDVWKIFFGETAKYEGFSNGFDQVLKNIGKDDMVALGSHSKGVSGDKGLYEAKDFNNSIVNIYTNHAYSIQDFSIEEGWCEIINPHDSGNIMRFKIDDLNKYFGSMFTAKFKK